MALSLQSLVLLWICCHNVEVTLGSGEEPELGLSPRNYYKTLTYIKFWSSVKWNVALTNHSTDDPVFNIVTVQFQIKNILLLTLLSVTSKCIARNFGQDSVVCECNSTYCDSVGSATLPPAGQFSSHLSSMSGSRLEASQGRVQANSSGQGEWRYWRTFMHRASSISSVLLSSRPQADHRAAAEVPEDERLWWRDDGCSRY